MSEATPRRQCAKCPWKVTTDPFDIPNGYDPEKHRALAGTIARPASLEGVGRPMNMMACHETPVGAEQPCVGWLGHQLGPGNNLALRLAASMGQVPRFELDGEQHERFEDTLP